MPGGIQKVNKPHDQRQARLLAAGERLRRAVRLARERSSEMGNGMVLFSAGDWWAVKLALDNFDKQEGLDT